MAHELIERTTRRAGEGALQVAYRGEVPWYGLDDAGTAMPDGRDVDAWLARSGLNAIHVVACEAWAAVPAAWGFGPGVRCDPEIARMLVERHTGRVFGACGPAYTPVQFHEIVDAMRPLLASGRAELSCMAPLRGGRTMFATLRVASHEVSRGDRVDWYLVATSSHDGTSTIRFYLTAVRVVCANTLATSLANRFATVSIRHTPSASDRLAAFSQAVANAEGTIRSNLEAWRTMRERCVTAAQATAFVAAIVPERPDAGERARANDAAARDTIASLYRSGRGAEPGTVWGLYQAATQYASHVRSAKLDAEARLRSIHEGAAREIVERAETLALSLAAA